MNLFIGDYKTFYKFFGGYARNHTLYLTKKYKSGVCACCGATDKEIESAHKRGLERSELVKKFFHESVFCFLYVKVAAHSTDIPPQRDCRNTEHVHINLQCLTLYWK